jgi:hypothetical protein
VKISCSMLAGASLLALGCASALAQQVTGVPGSPGATTTLDGKQLPPADPKFGGVIKEKASVSKAWTAPRGPRGCSPISFGCNNDDNEHQRRLQCVSQILKS